VALRGETERVRDTFPLSVPLRILNGKGLLLILLRKETSNSRELSQNSGNFEELEKLKEALFLVLELS
jgi:hypothetical protein